MVSPQARIHGSRTQIEVAFFTIIPGEFGEFVLEIYKYGSVNLKFLVPREEKLLHGKSLGKSLVKQTIIAVSLSPKIIRKEKSYSGRCK